MTSLGRPQLLLKLSKTIVQTQVKIPQIQNLFDNAYMFSCSSKLSLVPHGKIWSEAGLARRVSNISSRLFIHNTFGYFVGLQLMLPLYISVWWAGGWMNFRRDCSHFSLSPEISFKTFKFRVNLELIAFACISDCI